MKTILFILSLFLLISCHKNDNKISDSNELVGNWYLVKYEPGFSPTYNYTNEILWSFNTNNTISVSILNGTTVHDNLPLNTSGNYTYSVANNEIILNNDASYKYERVNNTLVITTFIGQSADGTKITFSRTN